MITSYYYSIYTNLSTSPRDSEGKVRPLIRGNKRKGSIFLGWLLNYFTGVDVTVVEEKFSTSSNRSEQKSTKTVFHRKMR